jgi:protein involved in polysaccharide export with SLBB domain
MMTHWHALRCIFVHFIIIGSLLITSSTQVSAGELNVVPNFPGLKNIQALPRTDWSQNSQTHRLPQQDFYKAIATFSGRQSLSQTKPKPLTGPVSHSDSLGVGVTPNTSPKPPLETIKSVEEIKPAEPLKPEKQEISSAEEAEQSISSPIPLAAGDSIDIQDSVMGLLVKHGNILSDGSISLPLIGHVTLAGKTVAEARRFLSDQYRQYFTEPQLSVRIVRRHPVRVYLTGAVANPGVYISGKDTRPETLKNQAALGEFNQQFRFYRLYLADALIMAGGLNYNANVRDIQIHRRYPEQKVLHVNVLELFQGGTTVQEIPLQDQDVVEVPALSENTLVLDDAAREFNRSNLNNDEFKISVIGAVNKPGGYVVHHTDNVLGAIAQAGGFTPKANPGRVFVLHATEQGQMTHRELNLQDKKLIGRRPFTEWAALLPNDVVFVDESAGRKMALYGRDLFFDRIAVAAMFPFFSKFFSQR